MGVPFVLDYSMGRGQGGLLAILASRSGRWDTAHALRMMCAFTIGMLTVCIDYLKIEHMINGRLDYLVPLSTLQAPPR